jgi:hypothetical protein
MNTTEIQKEVTAKTIMQAVKCFMDRQLRTENPSGYFDNAKRWYPHETEECKCCSYIRTPSRAYPFSIMTHCRTVNHIANLYKIDVTELRKAINIHKKILKQQEALSIRTKVLSFQIPELSF